MPENDLALIPFITHKLPIVLSVSDRVTVLRRGKVTARLVTSGATEGSLAKEMVGREVIFNVQAEKVEPGKPVLQVENISARNDKGLLGLNGISFSVHEGEIFGIAGVSGNGQQVLAEVLAGARKMTAGKVVLGGVDISHSSSLVRWLYGMGYIPAERIDVGSIGDFSLAENVLLNYHFDDRFTRWGIVDSKRVRQLTGEIIAEDAIAAPGTDTTAKSLSGGNLQKLIRASVLSRKPRLIIANLPTQGLDVGAIEFVQNKLLQARKERAAILLSSEDLDEVLSLRYRVAPMYQGEFMAILPADQSRLSA